MATRPSLFGRDEPSGRDDEQDKNDRMTSMDVTCSPSNSGNDVDTTIECVDRQIAGVDDDDEGDEEVNVDEDGGMKNNRNKHNNNNTNRNNTPNSKIGLFSLRSSQQIPQKTTAKRAARGRGRGRDAKSETEAAVNI